MEVSLLDAELSQYVPNLPHGAALSGANLVAYIESVKLPGGGCLRPPSGPPPEGSRWKTLSRMRAIRIAMQLCSESGERLFDPEKDEDLDAVERIGVDKLSVLWNAIERTFPFNGQNSVSPDGRISALADLRNRLKPKPLKALEIIEAEGPILCKILAKRIPVAASTLRTHIIPKLRPFGVKSDRSGYYIAQRSAT